MSEYRPRNPGGLVSHRYALPPTFSVGTLPDVPVTPSRFRGQRTGVSPDWNGSGNIMSFPNLNKAVSAFGRTGERIRQAKEDRDVDDEALATLSTDTYPRSPRANRSTRVAKPGDEPVDDFGDPGAPSGPPGATSPPTPTRIGPFNTPADQRAPWLEGSTRGQFSIREEMTRIDTDQMLRPGYVNPDPTKRTPWLPGSTAGTFPTQDEMEKLSPIPMSNTDKRRQKGGLGPQGSLDKILSRRR